MINQTPNANLTDTLLDYQHTQSSVRVACKGLLGTLFIALASVAIFQDFLGQEQFSSRMFSHATSSLKSTQLPEQTAMCNGSMNILEMLLPLKYVVPSHPEGGQCALGQGSPWFSQCGWAINNHDFSRFGDFERNSDDPATSYLRSVPTGRDYFKQATITYWGGTIKTNNNLYTFDDIYCHGNGWLSLPRTLVSNYTAWSSLARQKCHELAQAVPEYEYLSNLFMFGQSAKVGDAANSPVTQKILAGEVPSQHLVQQHAAWKCALDPDIGVACDMAYCSHNFCDLGDGYIGHTTECD